MFDQQKGNGEVGSGKLPKYKEEIDLELLNRWWPE